MSTEELSDALNFSADEPLLSLQLAGCGPVVLIEVGGEVDASSVHLLTELVQHVARDRPARLVLDMAKVSFSCTDGLRALPHARDTVTAAGGQLVLRASPHAGEDTGARIVGYRTRGFHRSAHRVQGLIIG
jgi:anti-anti-sigma factor